MKTWIRVVRERNELKFLKKLYIINLISTNDLGVAFNAMIYRSVYFKNILTDIYDLYRKKSFEKDEYFDKLISLEKDPYIKSFYKELQSELNSSPRELFNRNYTDILSDYNDIDKKQFDAINLIGIICILIFIIISFIYF
jgi:hypothetical protein